MDEKKITQLSAAGIDIQEAMSRFMDNEGLLMKFLLRFPQDESFVQLQQGLEAGDADQAYRAAHTLKGLAGNLAMKELFQQASGVTAELREGRIEEAKNMMGGLERRYQDVLEALKALG